MDDPASPTSSPVPSDADDESEPESASAAVGLADVMGKILRSTKPKKSGSKPIILSRAKKDNKVVVIQQKKGATDGDDNDNDNDEDVDGEEEEEEGEEIPVKRIKRKTVADNQLENLNRVKPDPGQDSLLEKQLARIATKGVVQLFNAVNVQQKLSTIKKESKHNNTRSTRSNSSKKIVTRDETARVILLNFFNFF